MEVKNDFLLGESNEAGQKASELTLQVSEERYRKIIECISEAVYEIDDKGVVTFISPSIEKLIGYTPEEITGTTILNFIDEKGYSLKERIQELKNSKEINGEFRMLTKAGEECWIRFSTKAKHDNEVFTGGYGILFDVSEKKKTEIALQKNEEKYRLLAENISDVIWVYNLSEKKFTYMSPSVYNLRGVTFTEAKNRQLEDDLAGDSVKTIQQRIFSTLPTFLADPTQKACYLDEVQIRKNDGSLIWIETNSHYNLTESGEIEIIGISRNIESRKQSEMYLQKYAEELEISEEKFYSIFNNSPVSMIISDPQSLLIMDVNEQMVITLGLEKKAIVGKKLEDIGIDIRDNWYTDIIKLLLQGKTVRNHESSIGIGNGEILDFQVSVDYIRIKGYEYYLFTAVDITQLKKKEIKIRHYNSQQKLIADISQLINRPADFATVLNEVLELIGFYTGLSRVCIFEDSRDGAVAVNTYEWCNTGIELRKEDMKEIPYKFFPSWKELLSTEGRIFSDKIDELPMDIFLMLEPGCIKSLLVYPLSVENKSIGFICFEDCEKKNIMGSDEIELLKTVSIIISNAFARKQIIDKLGNSELRLKLAIESAKEGLWDWNIATGDIFFSDIWCKLMGCRPHDSNVRLSGWQNRVALDDKARVEEAMNAHLNGETEFYEAVYRVNSKDGKLRWMLEHGMVVERNAQNKPLRMMGMIIDITGQKEIEQLLKESVESQQKLFSIIAHDLRGPLGNFVQILEMITNGRNLEEDMKNMFLEELKTASGSTYSLLENLLNWSTSQTNTIKIEPERLNISKILNENVEMMRVSALRKYINMSIDADEALNAVCDINSINLVIRNLLSNAIKFTNRNGEIKVSAKDSGENIFVEISDNGIGMEKNTIDKLFKLGGFRSTFGTEREKGTGIGLLLCKDFIERNGGEIHVESKPGEGSRFVITLIKN
jgi:PAS domain S-box-containing protein